MNQNDLGIFETLWTNYKWLATLAKTINGSLRSPKPQMARYARQNNKWLATLAETNNHKWLATLAKTIKAKP
jgi:hypothetical protein